MSSDREADTSDNFNDNDLQSPSNKSNNDTPSPDTPNQIGESKAVKRKADGEDNDTHSIITTSLRASIGSDPSVNNKERPRKSQRLRSEHGRRSTVDYNMKHHPMDDFLRPRYSAKKRANAKEVSKVSSDSDEEIVDDNKNRVSGKETSPNSHRRRSSRNMHPKDQPIYSAKWHPLDQMLKDNASSDKVFQACIISKTTYKSGKRPPTLKTEGRSMTITSDDDEPDRDAVKDSESGDRIMPNGSGQRRSARISSSKDGPRNYDMKYGDKFKYGSRQG